MQSVETICRAHESNEKLQVMYQRHNVLPSFGKNARAFIEYDTESRKGAV